ncbi:MAG: hypothetical protein K6D59_04220 [Bacteroidales bacterium]|nr:hypothetical protein [Bacteroidales bacterium]
MKKNDFKYYSIPDMTVGILSQEDYNLEVLHGRAILNEADKTFLFLQNTPRGPRSAELMRTRHSRLVLTPKGTFTLTFRFSPDEEGLISKLTSEMAEVCQTTEKEFINNIVRKDTL